MPIKAVIAVIGMVFPVAYTAFAASRMVVSQMDSGVMACWLVTPLHRRKISVTGGVYLVHYQIAMFAILFGVAIVATAYFQPDMLNIEIFGYLLLGGFLYHFAIGGWGYFAFCLFNTTGRHLLAGVALPLFLIFTNIIRQLVDSLDFLKYITLNTLLDSERIFTGSGFGSEFALLFGLVLYCGAIQVFGRKDLSP